MCTLTSMEEPMATSKRHSEFATRSWVVGSDAVDEIGAVDEDV